MFWTSAAEILFGIEGYDDDVDGSRVNDDMEVFGRGMRLELWCDCNLAAR